MKRKTKCSDEGPEQEVRGPQGPELPGARAREARRGRRVLRFGEYILGGLLNTYIDVKCRIHASITFDVCLENIG